MAQNLEIADIDKENPVEYNYVEEKTIVPSQSNNNDESLAQKSYHSADVSQ